MKMLRRVLALTFVVSLSALAQGSGGDREGGQRRPPPEALSACEGKSAGASCQFSYQGRNLTGTCFTPASDKPLACKPEGGPSGPQQGG